MDKRTQEILQMIPAADSLEGWAAGTASPMEMSFTVNKIEALGGDIAALRSELVLHDRDDKFVDGCVAVSRDGRIGIKRRGDYYASVRLPMPPGEVKEWKQRLGYSNARAGEALEMTSRQFSRLMSGENAVTLENENRMLGLEAAREYDEMAAEIEAEMAEGLDDV